jgi:hypothetical protein
VIFMEVVYRQAIGILRFSIVSFNQTQPAGAHSHSRQLEVKMATMMMARWQEGEGMRDDDVLKGWISQKE